MSASDSELQADAEDALLANLGAGVKRYRVGSREKELASPKEQLEALLILRGLQSPRRGISVARIDRAG